MRMKSYVYIVYKFQEELFQFYFYHFKIIYDVFDILSCIDRLKCKHRLKCNDIKGHISSASDSSSAVKLRICTLLTLWKIEYMHFSVIANVSKYNLVIKNINNKSE